MSSALIPPSVPIPQPPSFSSVKFTTIGQPPDLLKRISDPDTVIEYEEGQDNSMTVSRPSTPAPAPASAHNNEYTDRVSRPTLLQTLVLGNATMDDDTVMASPQISMAVGAQPPSHITCGNDPFVGATAGDVGAMSRPASTQTDQEIQHILKYPRASTINDRLARPQSQSTTASNVKLTHHNVSATTYDSQMQLETRMQTDSQTQVSKPTPELSLTMPTPSPFPNAGCRNDDATSSSNPKASPNAKLLALTELLEETTTNLNGGTQVVQSHLPNVSGSLPQARSDSRLSQIMHESNAQSDHSNMPPNSHMQTEPDKQMQRLSSFSLAPTHTQTQHNANVSTPMHLSTVPAMNLISNNANISPSQSHAQPHSHTSQSPGSPLDSALDSAKKWLDEASLAHAQFRDLLARVGAEASNARTIASQDAAHASTLLAESQAQNFLLNEENTKLKKEIVWLKHSVEELEERKRQVEEAAKIHVEKVAKIGDILRFVDGLDTKTKEEGKTEPRETKEKKAPEENEQRELVGSQAQTKKPQAEEAATFAKKRAEVEEGEHTGRGDVTVMREAFSGDATSSFAPAPANNSHGAKANSLSSNRSTTDGGASADDSVAVSTSLPIPAQIREPNPPVPVSFSQRATATPSILQRISPRHPDCSNGGNELKVGLGTILPQLSPASHAMNLRHLKDMSKNHTIGAGVEGPAPAVAEAEQITGLKIKMEVKKEEEEEVISPTVKMEDEEDELVSRTSEPAPDHQILPSLQPSPRLPTPLRSQSRSTSHSPVSNESLSLPLVVTSVNSPQDEASISPSCRVAPMLSRPSRHSSGSQPSDVAPNKTYDNEPMLNLPQRPPNYQSQPLPSVSSTPSDRENAWNSNQASGPVNRPLAPSTGSLDRHGRSNLRGRGMAPKRQYNPSRRLTPPLLVSRRGYHSSGSPNSAQHYSPSPSPPARNIQSRKRPRPEPDSYVPGDDLPRRRNWLEDPGYERHERPNHEYTIGPRTPPLSGMSEPEQYSLRSRRNDQQRNVVRSRNIDPGWEHQGANERETYGMEVGLPLSSNATSISSRRDVGDHPQSLAGRQQSPPRDHLSLLARMSDTQHPGPQGQSYLYSRRTSNQIRGGDESSCGAGQIRQTKRGGPRGGAAGSSDRQSLAARLGSSALQQRLS